MPSVGSPEVGLPSYNIHISDTNTNIGTPVRGVESLPDIVHSHSVPHALSPRPNQHRPTRDAGNHHHRQRRHQSGSHFRERNRRESSRNPLEHQQGWRRSRTHSSTSTQTEEGRCKEPCMKCMLTVTSFRWVLVVLSVLGVLCVVTGIVLAALHAEGNSFLFLAIMFIGLGVLLVIVVTVGWRCTPQGHEPLHALFSIGDFQGRRREHRHQRTHRHRDGNWLGGMMYPEFQHRRPPPSYTASMQEYNNQLALVQSSTNNNNNNSQINVSNESYSLPSSPPPSYRSRASTIHSGMHITFPPGRDSAPNSRPPTYRSRADSRARPRLLLNDEDVLTGPAPSDVVMGQTFSADAVQLVLGTGRYHQRHRSGSLGSDGVWHTRSSSLDLAQAPDSRNHRRGVSLDQLSAINMLDLVTREQTHHHIDSDINQVQAEHFVNTSQLGSPVEQTGRPQHGSRELTDHRQEEHVNRVMVTSTGFRESEQDHYNTSL